MTRLVRAAIVPLVLLLPALGACASRFDATKVGVPVTMASPNAQPAAGERFSVTSRAFYLLWGAVPLSQPSLEKVLAAELVDGSAVADLRINVRSRWSDVLVTALTLGIIAPRAVTFEGVVVGRTR
ncbi:MAG TPA: hypothetical protein VLA95_02540 [Gemmatimonadales bacterium]|nr:hypothetical protein [Gemmatimonadales bacterium]